MPIDERLRTGLARNTELLVPDIERALTTTYGRAHSRRRVRRGALALATAAAVAVTAWAVDLPGLDDDAVPVLPIPTPSDLVGYQGSLDPGSYSLAVWGEAKAGERLPRAIVDVPPGYFSNGGYVIDAGHDVLDPEDFGVVQVWWVNKVLVDPCRRSSAADVGPTVEDLARALTRQTGPSSRPRSAVLDGYDGLSMEVRVPRDTELATCTAAGYRLWMARGGSLQHSEPGVVHHLWILDVDGTRLVVAASLYPHQDPAQQQELLAMAESIHFESPSS